MIFMRKISTIIGLGNIGKKYVGTRHNLGFELIDILAGKWGIKPSPGQGNYYWAEKEKETGLIRLIWPTTYMNNSGLAVAQVMEHFQLSTNELLVVFDDFNLPLGKVRIRVGGSDGGHNGMASIIENIGTDEIIRLRMGVGPLPIEGDPVVFVLTPFKESEMEIRNKMLGKAVEAVLYLLDNNAEKAMSIYNPAPEDA